MKSHIYFLLLYIHVLSETDILLELIYEINKNNEISKYKEQ